mmetsp:Transcript_43405/g.127684  ORF Transcript_43405/g.127684 Transcript_43405/m.127684 type:complete len:252 (+) Transcript_43405:1997-2752(+)
MESRDGAGTISSNPDKNCLPPVVAAAGAASKAAKLGPEPPRSDGIKPPPVSVAGKQEASGGVPEPTIMIAGSDACTAEPISADTGNFGNSEGVGRAGIGSSVDSPDGKGNSIDGSACGMSRGRSVGVQSSVAGSAIGRPSRRPLPLPRVAASPKVSASRFFEPRSRPLPPRPRPLRGTDGTCTAISAESSADGAANLTDSETGTGSGGAATAAQSLAWLHALTVGPLADTNGVFAGPLSAQQKRRSSWEPI